MPNVSLGVELFISGAWLDITSDVYQRDGITISRGRANESGSIEPSSMGLTINNAGGKYSPRNPSSPYYGLIRRNTPVRAYVNAGTSRSVQNANDQYFQTTEVPDITGDLEIRVSLNPMTWRPGATSTIGCNKRNNYALQIDSSGYLLFVFSEDGTTARTIRSSQPIPGGTTGRKALRATFDADNGYSGCTVTFYVSDDGTVDGDWTQIGAPMASSGVATLNADDAPLHTLTWIGLGETEVFELRVYDGIGGTVVADVNFTAQDVTQDVTDITDDAGLLWQRVGAAHCWNRRYRFLGEVTEWPQRWDGSGSDIFTPISCSGILRRLGQGDDSVDSALLRGVLSIGAPLVSYWPMEDDSGARNFLQAKGRRGAGISGAVEVADSSPIACSGPMPKISTGSINFPVDTYPNSGEVQIRLLASAPDSGITTSSVILRMWSNSTLGWADLVYTSGGGLTLKLYSNTGVLGHTVGPVAMGFTGNLVLSLEFRQDGSDIDMTMAVLPIGQDYGVAYSSTKTGMTLGSITRMVINPDAADLGDLHIGHVSVEKKISDLYTLATQYNAYFSERADTRIARLCTENSVYSFTIGAGSGAGRMGSQKPLGLTDLLKECAASDYGVLYEATHKSGLVYRTLESMCSQDPRATISYPDGILQKFEPVDDDQQVKNRITVKRDGGSSYTVEDSTGSLSTAAPPNGVGIYESSTTVSLYSDVAAKQHASWLLNIGTVDEARYPSIGVELMHHGVVADSALTDALCSVNIGDVIEVTDLPSWLPPEDVRQVVQGIKENIDSGTWYMEYMCSPASPYDVGEYVGSTYAATSSTGDTDILTDNGTGKADYAVWDTSKWITEGTSVGGQAYYLSNALKLLTGPAGGYSGSARMSLTANVGSIADTEISGTAVFDANEPYLNIALRADTIDVDYATGYMLAFNPVWSEALIFRIDDYTATPIATVVMSFSAGTTYNWKFRAEGPMLSAKLWTGSEPTSWSMSATDTTYTTGKVGISLGAGNAAVQHAVVLDDIVVTDGGSGSIGYTPVDAGPSDTRYDSTGSTLATAIDATATSLSVAVASGPLWTTDADNLPIDITVFGERMTVTAVSGAVSPQTFTVTRAVNGVSRPIGAGADVRLHRPMRWGARPIGGEIYSTVDPGTGSGGTPSGGGTGSGEETVPNTVQIGSATYVLSGVDPGETGGWGGDSTYPASRGVDQIIIYNNPPTTPTGTNQWGVEVVVTAGAVASVNDREATQDLVGTTIPSGSYVISGNGAAAAWLRSNATVGAEVSLIYVDASGGSTGTGGSSGSTGGSSTVSGTYPAMVVSLYKLIYSSSYPNMSAIPTACNEIRLAFAFGSPIALAGYGAEGQSSFIAGAAAKRAAGCRVIVSLGGAGNTVGLTTSTFMTGLANIYNNTGGNIDGIDWDIEAHSFTTAQIRDISVACKNTYGSGFAITFAPTGSKVAEYLAAAKACHDADALDNYGQQFYDAPVSLAAAKGRITEAINYGIPASKLSVGMMIGSDANHWTNAVCRSNMADIRATYGIRKAYLWEAGLSGTSQWVTDMVSVLS